MRKILSPFLGSVRKSRHTFCFIQQKIGQPSKPWEHLIITCVQKKKKTSICASCTKAHRLYDKLYNEEISEPKACWKRF